MGGWIHKLSACLFLLGAVATADQVIFATREDIHAFDKLIIQETSRSVGGSDLAARFRTTVSKEAKKLRKETPLTAKPRFQKEKRYREKQYDRQSEGDRRRTQVSVVDREKPKKQKTKFKDKFSEYEKSRTKTYDRRDDDDRSDHERDD